MDSLSEKRCVPCHGGVPPLREAEITRLHDEIDKAWRVVDGHHLERELDFADFKTAMAFALAVGELAESEGHHPDIYLSWGKVRLTLWTHKIDGLSESDFILAAKIDRLAPKA